MPTTNIAIPKITLNDGATIPQLGYGTLALQPDRDVTDENTNIAAQTVSQALQAGYRHIDTAQAYGTEPGVGKAIAESGIAREEIYITSKLANANHAPDDVERSFKQTMSYLGVDQVDLFLVHWPLPTLYGGDYVSTWTAVTELVSDGRARSVGVSNFQPAHLERIIAETGITPAVNQVELHPYFANSAVIEACAQHRIAVEAHSPLGHSNAELDDPAIQQIAAAHERSVAQIILRWHMQHGYIAIPKSARPERMAENINVFDFDLSTEQMSTIDALDKGEAGRVGPNPDTYEGV
ncbi:MAG TPA: aldo/keto reductase [Solirubrobacteraceae bacterium]|nr:aldo/keto reductase [Solirubrobacteraceae bacterium]